MSEARVFIVLFMFSMYHLASGQSVRTVDAKWSIDPDAYAFSIKQIEGRWKSKVGGEYFVSLYKGNKMEIKSSIGAFINIENFVRGQAFSWQIWRGNLGGSLYFNLVNQSWLPRNSRLDFKLSYVHESQHATDTRSFAIRYLTTDNQNFDNGGIRSFEYVNVSARYVHGLFEGKLAIPIKLGYKHFPTPSLQNTRKLLDNAHYVEIGIQYLVFKNISAYSQFYYERMNNRFDYEVWGYRKDLNGADLVYRLWENGLVFTKNNKQTLGIFLYYTHSNGRSLDFVDETKAAGGGLRFFL